MRTLPSAPSGAALSRAIVTSSLTLTLAISGIGISEIRAQAGSEQPGRSQNEYQNAIADPARQFAAKYEAESAAFQRFLVQHPGNWQTRWSTATGTPQHIYGPGLTVDTWLEDSMSEARRHALLLLERQSELLGLGLCEFREAIAQPIGNNYSFVFDQYYRGLPVLNGRADVRVHRVGQVSMFGSLAIQIPADLPTVPAIAELEAKRIAWSQIETIPTAEQPGKPRAPRLVIWADMHAPKLATPHLAWEIPVSAIDATGQGKAGRYYVSAVNGDVLHFRNDKHECGFGCSNREVDTDAAATRLGMAGMLRRPGADKAPVVAPIAAPIASGGDDDQPSAAATANASMPIATGIVRAWVRLGKGALDPLINVPLPNVEVDVPGVGTVVTDNQGMFTVNIQNNVNVTVDLDGVHCQLIQGPNAPTAQNPLVPGLTTTFQILWQTATPDFAAHTNVYYFTNEVNEWARATLGNTSQLASLDGIQSRVNLNFTCNAYYLNNTMNFYQAGGGCRNSAYSSVVAHEWGHGLDDRYGGISQTNGLSEGWADICGMYLLDDAIIGQDFLSAGGYLRAGTNTRQYPNGSGVHSQGESFMGFAWKLRDRLAQTLSSRSQAIQITNRIVLGSIAANAQDQPSAVLEIFLADDNDANLLNGTPHSNELTYAALRHSIPYPNTGLAVTNDSCATAIPLLNGVHGPFTCQGASTSAPAWPCGNGANDVWFSYNVTNFGTLDVDTCFLAAFDTVIEVFSGSCGNLTSVGCNDDACGTQSSLSIPVSPGTYYIRVGSNGAPGGFNLDIEGPSGNPAGAIVFGDGCYRQSKAFYEFFNSTSNFDLDNQAFQLISLGNAYFGLTGGSFVAPTASATTLALQDDDAVTVNLTTPFNYPGGTTSTLEVCSNGFVSVAAGNGTSPLISPTDWLNGTVARWGCWHDFDPSASGGGSVLFEEIGGIAHITWDGVYSAGTTTPRTFQLQFDPQSGTVTYAWQTMSGVGTSVLVGYSHVAPNFDAGNLDLTAELAGAGFSTAAQNKLGLTLTATPPVLGGSSVMTTTEFPQGSGLGFQLLGFQQFSPGIELSSFGMPGCHQFVSNNATVILVPSGGQGIYTGPIPNDTNLMGVRFNAQSAALAPSLNALGLVTSNGVQLLIGT